MTAPPNQVTIYISVFRVVSAGSELITASPDTHQADETEILVASSMTV